MEGAQQNYKEAHRLGSKMSAEFQYINHLEELYEAPQCLGKGELFYGPDGIEKDKAKREKECKAICYTCDHRIACLQTSLKESQQYGVWGGMGEAERKRFTFFLMRNFKTKKPGRAVLRKALKKYYQEKHS